MAQPDKLAIANRAITKLPPVVRANGTYSPATAAQPANWQVKLGDWRIILAEGVLLCPTDSSLSSLLDIWAASGGKVLSVSWMPDEPWVPPRIVRCKSGAWQELLGE